MSNNNYYKSYQQIEELSFEDITFGENGINGLSITNNDPLYIEDSPQKYDQYGRQQHQTMGVIGSGSSHNQNHNSYNNNNINYINNSNSYINSLNNNNNFLNNNNNPSYESSPNLKGLKAIKKEKRPKSDKSDRHAVLISTKGDKINLAILLKQLEECGPVRAHHFRERQNFGFVQFLDSESADNAIEKLDLKDIDGQIITVQRIKRITPGKDPRIASVGSPQCSSLPTQLPSMIENKPDSTLVLKNLPFNLKQLQLQEILEGINPSAPQSVNFHYDNIGVFRGMAFVKYRLVEDAVKVYDALNGADVHGRRVRLEYKRKVSKSNEVPQEVLEDEQLRKVWEQLKEFKEDPNSTEINFNSFSGVQRMYIHNMAEKLKLNHTSTGEESTRSIVITNKKPQQIGTPSQESQFLSNSPPNSIGSGVVGATNNNNNNQNNSNNILGGSTSSYSIGGPSSFNSSNLNNGLGSYNNNGNSLSTTPPPQIITNKSNIVSPPTHPSSSTATASIASTQHQFNSTIGFNIPSSSSNSTSTTNNNNISKPKTLNGFNMINNNSSININSNNNSLNNSLNNSASGGYLTPPNTTTPTNSLSSNSGFLSHFSDSKIGTSWEKSNLINNITPPSSLNTASVNGNTSTPTASFLTIKGFRDRSYSASALSSDIDLSSSPNWRTNINSFGSIGSNSNSNGVYLNNNNNNVNNSSNINHNINHNINNSNNININHNINHINHNNNNNNNILSPSSSFSSPSYNSPIAINSGINSNNQNIYSQNIYNNNNNNNILINQNNSFGNSNGIFIPSPPNSITNSGSISFNGSNGSNSFNSSPLLRQPKGPDGTKGFSDGYKARKLGQSPITSILN